MDMNHTPPTEYHYSVPDQETICERNKQTIRRFLEHDFSVYEDIVAKDISIHGPATGQETRGIEAAKRLDTGYAIAYPDANYEIQDLLAVDDKVIVRWSVSGTHLGERNGLQISGSTKDLLPTNKKIFINGVHIYRFNDEGLIVESWAMWDRLGEIEQICDIKLSEKQ